MTAENQAIASMPTEVVDIAHAEAAHATANPVAVVHSLLRGRYTLAICLALVGLAVGVPAGYMIQKPKYKSVGIVRIEPILHKILYATDQNGIMPMFESFLASQVAQIQSRRVIELSIAQPEWKSQGHGMLRESIAAFEASLEVSVPKGTPLIQISFTDGNANAAAIAVKAVIDTYQQLYKDNETASQARTIADLQNLKAELTTKVKNDNDQIKAIAQDFGSSSLRQVYESKLDDLNQLEKQVREAQIKAILAGVDSAPATTMPTTQSAATLANTLILKDPVLQQLEHERENAARQAHVAAQHYGPNHPNLRDAQGLMDFVEQQIKNRIDLLQSQPELVNASVATSPGGLVTRDQLAANEKALRALYEQLQKETIDLGKKNLRIEELRADADEQRSILAETNNRLVQLNVESADDRVGGRLTVISYGDLPMAPDKDKRKALAAAGGAGFAGLGIGFVMLLGLLDRRIHYIDSAKSRFKRIERMLGVLPELPNDLTDPEQAAAAAYCVHQIRAMLQIRQSATGHKVFSITSASPGDGKTSLTITLGMSLAASGCKTLVVDFDMDGGGLTSRLGHVTHRPLGQILIEKAGLTEPVLEEAIVFSRSRSIRLGQALCELGHVTEATILEAVEEQRRAGLGVADVLAGVPLEQAISQTGYPMLSVLSLGAPSATHAGRVSPDALRRLFDRLAGQFDTVLVDCAPILGSVEAAIVSAEADGVILVLSRGGDRSVAEKAVNFLTVAGADVEGIVFNRADSADMAKSVYSSSPSIRSQRTHNGAFTDRWTTITDAASAKHT